MTFLFIVIIIALIFDFINGFHDAANAIATIVSTRVLTPFKAVLWAASFNFVAYFIAKYIIGEFGIADTVSKTVYAEFVTLPIILSGLIAAITWNLFTWWLGLPSSSSHTLIGGFAGAAIAAAGLEAIHLNVVGFIAIFIVVAPLIGFTIGMLIMALVMRIARNARPRTAEKWFRRTQLASAALLSIGHGLNDAQKVMGIIAAAIIAYSVTASDVPAWLHLTDVKDVHDWIAFSCFFAIALGTMAGGWRIMKTMGRGITKITSLEGSCAETAAALTLFIVEVLRVPVSTTHVITGSIIGVGAVKRLSAVRWGVTRTLLWAWILTIPVSALLSMLIYKIVTFIMSMF
ncbi:MAG: inorganic phosphate transporter [Leptospirales bacterium]|nr:inorganic phosphate transporter [Leptospirales bacterium]